MASKPGRHCLDILNSGEFLITAIIVKRKSEKERKKEDYKQWPGTRDEGREIENWVSRNYTTCEALIQGKNCKKKTKQKTQCKHNSPVTQRFTIQPGH